MKSLFVICLLIGICGKGVNLVRDYIFNPLVIKQSEAQDYCKQHYGNLDSITSEQQFQKGLTAKGPNIAKAWIGLIRTEPHVNRWKWVNGEEGNFTKWKAGEPNDMNGEENCVVMDLYGWYDTSCDESYSSICSQRFTLVNRKSTWNEALQYCRKNYTDLAFVDSGLLLDLLKIETVQAQTASVWTGLRFINGKWFWVNGMQLGSLVSQPLCPAWPYHCGAYNFNTNTWENRDCNEELNFFCYF